jgi:hypothetical protein
MKYDCAAAAKMNILRWAGLGGNLLRTPKTNKMKNGAQPLFFPLPLLK